MNRNVTSYRSVRVFVITLLQCLIFNLNAGAHEGWGIVVDTHGQIYFSDIPTNTIWKINRFGKLQIAVANQHSHALILGSDGNIYGSHENGRVWKITSENHYTEILPPNPDFPLNLHCFNIDNKGNIYSMNAKGVQSGQVMLIKRSADGNVTTIAGSAKGYKDGNGIKAQFIWINGMAWAPDSSLYLTDGPYVRKVTMEGVVSTVYEKLTTESKGEDLYGLTVSSTGDLFIADYSGRQIIKIKKDGKVRTILKSGSVWSPTGVAVNGQEIYVLEHLRMPLVLLGNVGVGPYIRIRKVAADGKVTTVHTVWGKSTYIFLIALFFIILFVIYFKRLRKR
jgi:sugar lactone lactonase YvrE